MTPFLRVGDRERGMRLRWWRRYVFRSSDGGELERGIVYDARDRTFRFFVGHSHKRPLGEPMHARTLELAAERGGFATDVAGVSFSADELRWALERARPIAARAVRIPAEE